MFFVKEKISDTMEVGIQIMPDNVYAKCPKCGCDHKVDLNDVFEDEPVDLFGVSIYCEKCSKEES